MTKGEAKDGRMHRFPLAVMPPGWFEGAEAV